jgi:signal transduction histidine kinase
MAMALHVLVVDDSAPSSQDLCQKIDVLGHISSNCSSGKDALKRLQHTKPDIVLLDLLMPDLDGYKVIRQIRQIITDRWLPIIVTSGLKGESHFIDALSLGADDYLSRPVNVELLNAKLNHYKRVLSFQNHFAGLAHRERLIYQHIPEALISFDGQGIVSESNRAAVDMLHALGKSDPIGQSLESLLGISVDQADHAGEVQWTLADGRVLPVELSCSRWINGAIELRTLLIRDLSEKKRLESMKEEFMATVSHELRTPLTSIVGALGILESGVMGELPSAAHDMLQVARRNSERLRSLIDDVLDLTKLQGNQLSFHMQYCELSDLARESISTNLAMAQAKHVKLSFQDTTLRAKINVDPNRLLQVFANLLSNAVKHAPSGSEVLVRLSGCAFGWRLEVQDQGPGVSLAFRKRLFEKFAQEDSSDRRIYGGTGLGLYISKMLMERMGGRIGLMSPSELGACFYIELPAVREAPSRPVILGITHDTQEQSNWRAWLQDQAETLTFASLGQVNDWILENGPPDAVIFNPAGQGPADQFCEALLSLVNADQLILVSDSVDAQFAGSHAFHWIGRDAQLRQNLQDQVRKLLERSA